MTFKKLKKDTEQRKEAVFSADPVRKHAELY